jgi:hypothetical protein
MSMDINYIRQLLREGHSVVVVEEGHAPLQITELQVQPRPVQEVPIASRWPKARPLGGQGRSVREGRENESEFVPPPEPALVRPDPILDRLNREIMALKAQIAEDQELAP